MPSPRRRASDAHPRFDDGNYEYIEPYEPYDAPSSGGRRNSVANEKPASRPRYEPQDSYYDPRDKYYLSGEEDQGWGGRGDPDERHNSRRSSRPQLDRRISRSESPPRRRSTMPDDGSRLRPPPRDARPGYARRISRSESPPRRRTSRDEDNRSRRGSVADSRPSRRDSRERDRRPGLDRRISRSESPPRRRRSSRSSSRDRYGAAAAGGAAGLASSRRRSTSSSHGGSSHSPSRYGRGRSDRHYPPSASRSKNLGGGGGRRSSSSSAASSSRSDKVDMMGRATRTALEAGTIAALKMRNDPSPWIGVKGAKVATAAVSAVIVNSLLEKKAPSAKGGMRHKAMAHVAELAIGNLVMKPAGKGIERKR